MEIRYVFFIQWLYSDTYIEYSMNEYTKEEMMTDIIYNVFKDHKTCIKEKYI